MNSSNARTWISSMVVSANAMSSASHEGMVMQCCRRDTVLMAPARQHEHEPRGGSRDCPVAVRIRPKGGVVASPTCRLKVY
eukprot:7173006-Prymnesium_polylepis.2